MCVAKNSIDQGTSIPSNMNKLALVVGVNTSSIAMPYRSALKYAEKDAEDMASLLKQPECGFTLLVPALTGEKAASAKIKQSVIELVKNRSGKDFLLFYYAGHALPIDNDIYFITHDFREEDVEVDPDFFLSMRWLWKVLYQSTGAGRVLLILDCCYAGNMVEAQENPLKIDFRKLLDEWNTGSNGKDPKNCLRLVLTATGYNITAQEQDGHGLMTGFLLKALQGEVDEVMDKDGCIDVRLLHKYLQEKMPKEQAPDLAGKFGPYNCVIASYPERAVQPQSQYRPVRGAKQPQNYIPFPRNPLFQPRPGEFERLETLLSGEKAGQPACIALVGMGGIGKTQLAVELAYRMQEQHRFTDGIFWTTATGTNVFEWLCFIAELAFNTDYLSVEDDPSSPENEARRARYFCRYLANHPDALLILDNVEEPELVISALPILAGGSLACSILYTSRITQMPRGVVAHWVKRLPENAALRLLLETTRSAVLSEALAGSQSPETRAARSVCSIVGSVPLALAHLRSFLQQDRQVSLCRLEDVLTKRGISGVAAAVTETFRLSWEKVRTDEARRMFLLASYFPEAAPIPLWLLGLTSGLGENGDIFEPLGQARFELHELGLLEELSHEQVRLHPLVRAFGQQLVRESANQGVDLRREAEQQLVEAGTDLNWLEGQARKEGYPACLQHVREMLAYAEQLSSDTAVEALRKIERLLDQESYLLADKQWWPKRWPGLFYQHLYNRVMETGQSVKVKQAPVQWVRQTKPNGAMDQSLVRIFAGHTDLVSSVAFSPDGKLILTGSWDGTARLWESNSGKELSCLQGHTAWVLNVAFSPDGKLILTGSWDGTARLWEASSGKELSCLQGHTNRVSSVAFSPDGKLILTGSWDGTARLWEASSGKELSCLQGHTGKVDSVAFSPDGKLILTGSHDKTARLWEASNGKEFSCLQGHTGKVSSVAFSPDGKLILTGSDDYTARFWEASSGEELACLPIHTALNSVAFSPDGKLILTGSWSGTPRLWEISSGKELSCLQDPTKEVNSVAFSPDGKLILTGLHDKTARLWEISSGKELSCLQGHTARVSSAAFSPDGKLILTNNSYDHTACLWEASNGEELSCLQGHTGMVLGVAFSPDGKHILTGSNDNTVRLWEASSGKELSCLQGHTDSVVDVAFSPDGKLILTGSLDKTARLWKASSGKELSCLQGHTAWVKSVVFSPDGKLILTGLDDGTARLWESGSSKELFCLQGHTDTVNSVAFSPDGRFILTGSLDKTARLWKASSGKELSCLQGHTGSVRSVAFSPDGCLAVTCDTRGWVFFWRIDDLEAKDPLALYVAYYPVLAVHWQDKRHVVLADNGGPRNFPYLYDLELEGMG